MGNDSILRSSIAEVSRLVKSHQISPVELATLCLARIESRDRQLNSFIRIFRQEAITEAREAENDILRGRWRGPLHGIPLAVKDLIDIAGQPTTAASALFLNKIVTEDADVVEALRAAGAIIIGKNNLHEFAYGGSGMISHFGFVRNPKDPDRITGGSSSGSAAAVAAGFCYATIGTDTAGSIRLPAACCGVVGLKPRFGRLSVRGVVPLAASYDHVGPIARTAEDVDLVCRVLAGEHLGEETVGKADRLRVGVAREYFFEGLEPQISSDVEEAIAALKPHVRSVHDISVPIDEDRTVASAESWEYHKQFMDRAELYQPPTLQRIRSGEKYTREEVEQKRGELERMRRSVNELFREVDVILSPTVPISPPRIADLQAHPENLRAAELLMLRNTRPWNVYGIPAVTVPCGEWAGLQVAGLTEAVVMRLAKLVKRVLDPSAKTGGQTGH